MTQDDLKSMYRGLRDFHKSGGRDTEAKQNKHVSVSSFEHGVREIAKSFPEWNDDVVKGYSVAYRLHEFGMATTLESFSGAFIELTEKCGDNEFAQLVCTEVVCDICKMRSWV